MAEQTENGDVSPNRLIGRRLLLTSEKPPVIPPSTAGGKHRFTMNAFIDKRGNLSVDVFWTDSTMGKKGINSYLAGLGGVCTTEGQEISGWAVCKTGHLVERARDAVQRVRHTPTASNPHHADIVRHPRLAVVPEDESEDLLWKARMVAKVLEDYFNSHGRFEPRVDVDA